MNPTQQPPSDEAVKAALSFVEEKALMDASVYGELNSHRDYPTQPLTQVSARILAAHARAMESEVARLREALERIDKGEKDTRAFRCGSPSHHELTREAMQDIARKALTGEASA